MSHPTSVAGRFAGRFDEAALAAWAGQLRAQLAAPEVSLGLAFLSPGLESEASTLLEILRVHARIPLLAGCSGASLIENGSEWENPTGVVLGLYHLPGAQLTATRFHQAQVERRGGPAFWHQQTGAAPAETNGWLVFADPFHLDAESWLAQWNAAYPGIPIVGGLASGDFSSRTTQVHLNGEIFEQGGVAIRIGGQVTLETVISQGCTPIGETWTITRAEGNVIQEIANRPAYEVLAETYANLTPSEQRQARGNLFVGLVVNEYLEEFHRGDFLIRNLLGADPNTGAIAVGAHPRPGQTVQFQRRVASAATEDLTDLLVRTGQRLAGRPVYGGCLCSCNGRGSHLFGHPDHDASLIQQQFGPIGLTGFFCNGEIGPIGPRNFLHGYTASLALFAGRASIAPPAG